ncbi:phosphate ABC transporter permease PstA [Paenibacillus thermotolerans]|uniref:phosphate ABC transporter permease PstA n=1 Tax=Paenibacillus thermotolerans TaxID=3027807 RepID=UPI002368ED5B|nr:MULTISPECIES: phosphate ABC transporter permease PstA [unclassified Paenibacillus]
MSPMSLIGGGKGAKAVDRVASVVFWGAGCATIALVLWLLYTILSKGLPYITIDFLTAVPDEIMAGGGIGPVLFNSFYVLFLSLLFSIPVGIGAGIYLAEYAPDTKMTAFLRTCVEGLASVPSIVFGLVGLALFVEVIGIGLTILGGAVSLAFLNLPVLVRTTEEAVRAVPQEIRSASYALGATKFQTIMKAVIPVAMQGIVTGISLTAGRAYGESAVIILTAGVTSSGVMWDFNLFSPGATLSVHLWYIQSEAIVEDARQIAEKSAAVLVFVVLFINLLFRIPLWLNHRTTKTH